MKYEERIGFEIRTLDNMLMRNFLYSVRACGLDEMTVMHGWIISYLYDNQNQKIYQKDIETQFAIGRSTVTSILKLMEKKEYLVREAVSCDARLKRLRLTENGKKLHEDTQRLIVGLDAKTVKGITEEELKNFYHVVAKLKRNLEEQRLERTAVREDKDD